jgi:hypothetical protein
MWLSLGKNQCLLKTASNLFGMDRLDCGACDHCRLRPVAITARNAFRDYNQARQIQQDARAALLEMREACPLCYDSGCDGTSCGVQIGSCHVCFGSHYRKDCPYGNLTQLLGRSSCHGCFEMKDCLNHHQHKIGQCLYKKRIKVLVFESARKSGIDCKEYIRQVYATPQAWMKFLANNNHRIVQHREKQFEGALEDNWDSIVQNASRNV